MPSFENKLNTALELFEAVTAKFSQIRRDLDGANIDFVVVGGAAVQQYGWERMTQDVDILMNRDDYERFASPAFQKGDVSGRKFGLLVHKPTGVHIDVLLGGDGVFPSVQSVGRSKQDHNLIAVEDLISLKSLRGDPSDYGDVYRIIKAGTPVDWQRVESLVSRSAWQQIQAVRAEVEKRKDVQ